MHVNDLFPSKYLRAADLKGNRVAVIIDRFTQEDIGTDVKPVLYFKGKEKGLVLNRTNANSIAELLGHNIDEWVGGSIELYPTKVDFKGEKVDAIRIYLPPPGPPPSDDGEIPF